MHFHSELRSFLLEEVCARSGDRVVVAFSGGPDSTALLWGLSALGLDLGLDVLAVHIDHGIDPDSQRRARAASDICRQLGVPLRSRRYLVPDARRPGESLEAAARRVRYAALEAERQLLGADYVATAHHADDQIETLLLRAAQGSGIEGLAGIRPRHGSIIRPLLRLRRDEVRQILVSLPVQPVEDPTNESFASQRNRLRHLVLPALLHSEPDLDDRLLSLSVAAARGRDALEGRVRAAVPLVRGERGPALELDGFLQLPAALRPFALSLLSREAGRPYPPSAAAMKELDRQLATSRRIGCDCGQGWRWETDGRRLELVTKRPTAPGFAYTVEAPGECSLPDLGLRFRIFEGAVDDWMFQPSSWRVGLVLPIAPGDRVVVRSRRNGDRIQPLGCSYVRRLKDVLIDRRIPRWQRGRLALLEVDSRLAWVPGVTIDDCCRVEPGDRVWIAELQPLQGSS